MSDSRPIEPSKQPTINVIPIGTCQITGAVGPCIHLKAGTFAIQVPQFEHGFVTNPDETITWNAHNAQEFDVNLTLSREGLTLLQQAMDSPQVLSLSPPLSYSWSVFYKKAAAVHQLVEGQEIPWNPDYLHYNEPVLVTLKPVNHSGPLFAANVEKRILYTAPKPGDDLIELPIEYPDNLMELPFFIARKVDIVGAAPPDGYITAEHCRSTALHLIGWWNQEQKQGVLIAIDQHGNWREFEL